MSKYINIKNTYTEEKWNPFFKSNPENIRLTNWNLEKDIGNSCSLKLVWWVDFISFCRLILIFIFNSNILQFMNYISKNFLVSHFKNYSLFRHSIFRKHLSYACRAVWNCLINLSIIISLKMVQSETKLIIKCCV